MIFNEFESLRWRYGRLIVSKLHSNQIAFDGVSKISKPRTLQLLSQAFLCLCLWYVMLFLPTIGQGNGMDDGFVLFVLSRGTQHFVFVSRHKSGEGMTDENKVEHGINIQITELKRNYIVNSIIFFRTFSYFKILPLFKSNLLMMNLHFA